ncbi:unnamed protein product [Arabis nemorensis]|uniref:Uncharacterized protein n=1 Tax=Arabis nemorensis TaxID=586526 RepID=A0A565CSM9_9BRAS|nr:unnamed protein product [Arabis nemorensis]
MEYVEMVGRSKMLSWRTMTARKLVEPETTTESKKRATPTEQIVRRDHGEGCAD